MDEMRAVVSRARPLEGTASERAERALLSVRERDKADEADLRAEFGQYFEAVA
jgi:beta-N-acetylhexosaminidase